MWSSRENRTLVFGRLVKRDPQVCRKVVFSWQIRLPTAIPLSPKVIDPLWVWRAKSSLFATTARAKSRIGSPTLDAGPNDVMRKHSKPWIWAKKGVNIDKYPLYVRDFSRRLSISAKGMKNPGKCTQYSISMDSSNGTLINVRGLLQPTRLKDNLLRLTKGQCVI